MVAMVKPYRHPKTGIFWIRKVIPERLRPQFGGRREFKVTLRTREPQEAKLLASARLIEFERRIRQVTVDISVRHLSNGTISLPQDSLPLAKETVYGHSPSIETLVRETLEDMFSPWQCEVQPKTKTADEYKKAMQEFHECVGVLPLQSIRTEHVRRYKDSLVSRGSLAAGTINKRVGVIKTLLNFARINGFINSNPAEGIKVKRTKVVAQRHPFTDEEIKAIFLSPVFKSNHRPRAGAMEAAYWMPVLAYYTGARLEEIGQLSLCDIQEHGGVWFIEITEGNGEANNSVKTEAGKRIIPLHPYIQELGFMSFLAKHKTKGRIFPNLKPDRYGSLTQNWSKWWSRYIKETVGIQENGKAFHAFRHTFAQLWKESGADPIIKDAVMGHSSGNNVQDRYGGWRNPKNGRTYLASPQQMMREVLKLRFMTD